MNRWLSALVLSACASTALAQGPFPVSGDYRFARVWAEHGSNCNMPLAADAVGTELGLASLAPNGTYSASSTEYQVCQTGSTSGNSGGGSGVYVVGADGRITIDPGPDEIHMFPGRDLGVLVWAGDSLNQEPDLSLAVRLSSGLDTTVLSGNYHFAAVKLRNDGSGTQADLWNGAMTFTGGGAYSATYQDKHVDPAGTTTYTNPIASGAYTVAADGELVISGFPGAGHMNGAVTSDGNMFFALDNSGLDVGLLIGVRFANGAMDPLFAGYRGGADFRIDFGVGPGLPQFCSEAFDVTCDGATATYTSNYTDLCQTPLGEGLSTGMDGGTFSVALDGSTCVFDSGGGPCSPGALDPTGSFGFTVDTASIGEIGFSFHVLTPLPIVSFCWADDAGAPCPCANPPAGPGRGCNNSASTGGASLTGAGAPSLGTDTLVLTTAGEKPTANSVVLQGIATLSAPAVFGQGLRCFTGTLKRLYLHAAAAGSITVPSGSDPAISVRSAALGDMISAGQYRYYGVYYRDPIVLGGCPSASTFNITNQLAVLWSL